MIDLRRVRNAAMALVAVRSADPEGLGRIVRADDGGQVLRIVEEKDATPEEREIEEINAGVYAFDAAWLRSRIGDVKPSPVSGEFYLPALVELAREDKRLVVSLEVEDDGTLAGINDRSQLAEAELEMRMVINERHMLAGVTFVDPVRTYVDASVELARDVVLEPGVILRGSTRIGEGTRIAAGSQIIDTVVGRDCVIWASVLESSEVEDEVRIGPFSHLRAKSSIGRGARLGNYAEVKASRLEAGVQQHHFSYIGDAEVGERTNVGAGTITCNYDGVRKHRTKIGKHVFLGSDTMLVAPLELGDEARTGRRIRGDQRRAGGDAGRGRAGPAPQAARAGQRSAARQGRMSDLVVELLVILFLVLIEAVFVAAEIALITIRRSRVEQLIDEGRMGARRVRRVIEDPSRLLAVVQIAVTFVGFLSSAYAAVNLDDPAGRPVRQGARPRPGRRGRCAGSRHDAACLVLHRVRRAGPKDPGAGPHRSLRHRSRGAGRVARPDPGAGRVGPHLGHASHRRRFRRRVQKRAQISTEELKLIVERGGEEGILEAEEEQMISAVIGLSDRRVHEVMVPRTDMSALPVTATLDEAIDTIIAEGHSRIPVYEETIDKVVGILYAKDLLPFLKGEDKRPDLRTLLRTPLFVPESMSIDDLLHQLQRRKVHIAIVLDEYGGTAGLVTIEDLLEEIVGEIQDEYDVEEPMTVRLSDDEARVDGRASVDDLAELFDFDLEALEDSEEYDTVGGLIYHRIGGVPQPGDKIELTAQGLLLTVESTDGHRVGKVLAARSPRDGEEPRPGR